MNKNYGITFLILCFGLSSVNVSLAQQSVDVPPIVVQPNDTQALNQQMLGQDRQNRDEEIAITNLVEENNKLTQTTLASQQDEGLAKINQTMLSYRNSLYARDRARIEANGQQWWPSRYGDLISLTEEADDMTVHQDLVSKSGMLAEKFQMLSDLKDEIIALNEKLSKRHDDILSKNQETIDGFKTIAQQQQEKIQTLVKRLDDMDQKINHLDDIIAEKDQRIAQLKNSLSIARSEASAKDLTIREQESQIAILQSTSKAPSSSAAGNLNLPPIIVSNSLAAKDEMIKQKQDQVDLLKSELENKITELKNQGPSGQQAPSDQQAQINVLTDKINQQTMDLKAKDEAIRWLNQVLAVTKNKAEYYKLTAQLNQKPLLQVQQEVQNIKADFAQHNKNYNQFEDAIANLKSQVSQLGLQLTQKQNQVDMLKAMLNTRQGGEANDDRMKLAKQLIDLQQTEASLLGEKSKLTMQQYDLFDRHFDAFEKKMRSLIANHQAQRADLQNRMEELNNDLSQKEQQVEVLNTELRNKITEEKNQTVLTEQIHDLTFQLQDKEDQIASMKKDITEGQKTQEELDSIKQQLASEQDKADQLKQELDTKTIESDKMTQMIGEYQKKLEAKDNAYNQDLKQVFISRNYQALMEKQIADLNARLQQKEAQVIKIKKDLYDLRELSNAKEREFQTKDLNLSIVQQKMMDEKVKEYQGQMIGLQATSNSQADLIKNLKTQLALSQQQLQGMPSSDEINFLRTGYKNATMQLKQKDAMLSQIKTNADEYAKEFKEQTQEFQSLKDQLLEAQKEIANKDEDLKYKDLAIARIKDLSRMSESDLRTQVRVLTQRVNADEKRLMSKTHAGKVEALQVQLVSANLKVKDLQALINQLNSSYKNDPAGIKLKQALDKIDEQGRLINVLTQKLLDCGQTPDLTKVTGKQ